LSPDQGEETLGPFNPFVTVAWLSRIKGSAYTISGVPIQFFDALQARLPIREEQILKTKLKLNQLKIKFGE
jgi:hypothetical protein